MADKADIANDYYERWLNEKIKLVRAEIPKGEPGICDYCDEESLRLIDGVCARCRDKYKLG